MRNILKIKSLTYNSYSNITSDIKKHVRITKNKQLKQTSKCGNVDKLSNTIKWDQLISFQFDDEKSLSLYFEIFDEHIFGFDQKQLLGVFHGQINLSLTNINQNSQKYDIYNLKKQRVGIICLEIDFILFELEKSQQKQEQSQNQQKLKIVVLSIITVFDDFKNISKKYKNVSCYPSLHIGNQKVIENNNKKFAQKIFWATKLKMKQISQNTMQLRINYKTANEQQNIICKGVLNLSDVQKNNKLKSYRIQLFGNQQIKLGYCLMQMRCGFKNSNLNPQNFRISKPKIIPTSILFSNQTICMPKANRFSTTPKRKANDKVGYSSPFSSISVSKQKTKSDSFGSSKRYSYKTIESSPGVGQYKLPSMFDKYY